MFWTQSRQELICLVPPPNLPERKGAGQNTPEKMESAGRPCSSVTSPPKAGSSARWGVLQTKLPESYLCLVPGLGHRNRASSLGRTALGCLWLYCFSLPPFPNPTTAGTPPPPSKGEACPSQATHASTSNTMSKKLLETIKPSLQGV